MYELPPSVAVDCPTYIGYEPDGNTIDEDAYAPPDPPVPVELPCPPAPQHWTEAEIKDAVTESVEFDVYVSVVGIIYFLGFI
jgi:hypothetical protein